MGALLDIQMLLIGGKERSLAEWTKLLEANGFRVEQFSRTRSTLSVLEAVPF